MTKSPTPDHYQRRVGGVLLDPYRIARVYGMTDDALFSALKKVLAAGKRGAKDKAKDVQDAIDALVRWQEMEREDATPAPMAAALDTGGMVEPRAYCPGADGHTCDGGRLVECDEHGETDAGPCPHCNPPSPQTGGGQRVGKSVMMTTPGAKLTPIGRGWWASAPGGSNDQSESSLVRDIATILQFREGNHFVDEAARVAARIAELESLAQSVTSALPPQVLDDVPLALPDRVANLVDDLRTARRRIAGLERRLDRAVRDLKDGQVEHSKLRALHAKTVRERDEARAKASAARATKQSMLERMPVEFLIDKTLTASERVQAMVDQMTALKVDVERRGDERDRWRQTAERVQSDLDALRKTLETERQAAVATDEELERVRKELGAQSQRAADAEAAFRKERTRADALHGELSTARHDLTALGGTYHAEMDFRIEMRRELGARDDEGFPDFLRRVCLEFAALRDRYRPRRQSEEPAPEGESVLVCGRRGKSWTACRGAHVADTAFWTHQPPALGEGEA